MCRLCDGKMKIVHVFYCKVLFINCSGDLHYLKYHLNICAQRSCLCLRKVRLHQTDEWNKCNRLFVTVIKKKKIHTTIFLLLVLDVDQDVSSCWNILLWPQWISARAEGRTWVVSDCNIEELRWRLKSDSSCIVSEIQKNPENLIIQCFDCEA